MSNLKVNAVVVTYNRKEMLVDCLTAILKQSFPVAEITLIDNASTDKTEKYLKEKGFLSNEKIKYIKLKKNVGGAGGFYYGLKVSRNRGFDWAWVMDDDVVPEKDSLKNLVNSLKNIQDRNVSFLASAVYGINGEFMNVPTIDSRNESNGYPSWYRYLDKGIVTINMATFVSLLINYDAIMKVGLPVKEYFIWGDDSEYTQRLTKYYGNAYFIGNSKVLHKRQNSKSLSIFNLDDKNRLSMVWRMYCNNLINLSYYGGKKATIKKLFRDCKLGFNCLRTKMVYLKQIKL